MEAPVADGSETPSTYQPAELLPPEECQVVTPTPYEPPVAVMTLSDRSVFYGEIDISSSSLPHGFGVLHSAFGSKYAGEIQNGKKHGMGVETYINGTSYFGEFVDNQPSGYGVHISPFGERYSGQWLEGARHGWGICVDAEASITLGYFQTNELKEEEDSACPRGLTVMWSDLEVHVHRALLAERKALRCREIARDRHMQAIMKQMTAIDSQSFRTVEEIRAFEDQEQQALTTFITEQQQRTLEIERIADEYKLAESRLKQRQKDIRAEISKISNELSYLMKYCTLANERQAQVVEAQRTLAMLQRQLQGLEIQRSHSEDESCSGSFFHFVITAMKMASPPSPASVEVIRKERFAVLSLNIFCRPEGIHSGKWFLSGDHKDLRVTLLLRKIQDFDVVILQEMFEVGTRQRRFIEQAHAMGFKYHCGSVWPSITDRYLIDGGLLILSRFPIVERGQHAYTQGSGSDGMCAKGVLYARIQLSPDLGDTLHVFTTHTQAGDWIREYSIRAAQLRELMAFIQRMVQDDLSAPILITGDFNLDARHNLTHDPQTGRSSSTKCTESEVYKQLVQGFEAIFPASAKRQVMDLMKQCDTTKLEGFVHPITNGDGHSTLLHKSDPKDVKKDGKCIDYMFYIPPPSNTGNSFSQHRSSSSSGGDALVNFTTQLRLVEERTYVDHCHIGPLSINGDQSLLPITHLSDHYGLRAEFSLEVNATTVNYPDGNKAELHTPFYELLQLHFPHHMFAQTPRRLWRWKLTLALLLIAGSATVVFCTIVKILAIGMARLGG